MSLDGRHALVTGGGRGIGRAVAAALAAAGASVSIVGRSAATLDAAVEAGDAHAAAVADVTDAAVLGDAIARLVSVAGPIDILVNNAGAAETAPFARTDAAHFARMMAVNLMAAVDLTRLVLGSMVERGFGRVVNVASTAGLKGYPYVTAYCTAKHALVGFTRALAVETARTGVTVNAVCPGYTDTDLVTTNMAGVMKKTGRGADEILAEMLRGNPQGRLVTPDEVGAAVVWICGPHSGAVTGQAVAVAGGEV